MAHTNSWDETYPPGGSQANTLKGSGILGNMLKNVRERMDDILGAGKWNADPVVGPFTGLIKIVDWSEGSLSNIISGTTYYNRISNDMEGIYANNVSSSIGWVLPLNLPVGCTLTKVRLFGYRNNASATFSFTTKRFRNNGTKADIHASIVSSSTAGYHYIDSGVISYTYLNTDSVKASISLINTSGDALAARFCFAELTYDLPQSGLITCIGG